MGREHGGGADAREEVTLGEKRGLLTIRASPWIICSPKSSRLMAPCKPREEGLKPAGARSSSGDFWHSSMTRSDHRSLVWDCPWYLAGLPVMAREFAHLRHGARRGGDVSVNPPAVLVKPRSCQKKDFWTNNLLGCRRCYCSREACPIPAPLVPPKTSRDYRPDDRPLWHRPIQ